MDIFSIFSPKTPEKVIPPEQANQNKNPKPNNISLKKKPNLNVRAADEFVEFSIHYKRNMLKIYLHINKKGIKETWKAELNETEMNKLLYNLFLIFSNPEPFQDQLQAVYPDQQLEQVLHINPNPPLPLDKSLEKLAELLNK